MRLDDVDVEELLKEERAQEPERPTFPTVPIADVLSRPEPLARFVWGSRIPRGYVTLLGAHGGTGKSVFSLQLAACVAMGLPFLGDDTERGKVLFWSAEDGTSTVRQRLANVVTHHGIDPEYLAEWLEVIDATTHPTLYQEVVNIGVREGATTPALDYLRGLLSEQHSLLVVDNASDSFDANENERKFVRGFVRSLASLAADFNIAVLLLAHVQKSAAETGRSTQSYSGSSAWHNSARSRLAMTKDVKSGEITLSHDKCNVGPLSKPMTLVFTFSGLLVQAEPVQVDLQQPGEPEPEKAVLALLSDFLERGEHVSTAPTAPRTNPWALLSTEPVFPRKAIKTATELYAVMRTLERRHLICRETIRTADRKYREIWTLSPEAWAMIGKSAPTAPTAPTPLVGTLDAVGASAGAPSAPTSALGSMRGKSAHTSLARFRSTTGRRADGTNPRALGTNLRAVGTNPRAATKSRKRGKGEVAP